MYCQTGYGQLQRLQTSGKLNFLRVHDVGTRYGPPTDQLDVEVIIKFSGNAQKSYGFKLRDDTNRLSHQGMLDLLRDAFNYNHTVTIDYDVEPGKNNGTIMRVWLTR
jgi:hypothetical protein